MVSKSYQNVRVGTREEESLETLSETANDCVDVMWKLEMPLVDCIELNGRYF